MSVLKSCDVVVLGGGAAGMMCAMTAGSRGRSVVLIEHNDKVGRKIAISGGGRCNFTNIHAGPENYLSDCPDFCRSALARYTPWDFIALVEKHGIRYHEKKLGQLFCDGSARGLIAMLEAECATAGVRVLTACRTEGVTRTTDGFEVATSQGRFGTRCVVVATGGMSFPKLGATGFGYDLARQFGIPVRPVRPGLVPLRLEGTLLDALGPLSGLSLPVRASFGGASFEESLLVTHRGVSGPAVLQISSYAPESGSLLLDLLPDAPALPRREEWRGSTVGYFAEAWPRRFADFWCANVPDSPRGMRDADWLALTTRARAWPLPYAGTEGFPKAEVTLGGIDARALSSRTMEAREVRGLFFIGEVVDVTGWLGGYNFQWAWASGHAAGMAL